MRTEHKTLNKAKTVILGVILIEIVLMSLNLNPNFDGNKYSIFKLLAELKNQEFWLMIDNKELKILYIITACMTTASVIFGLIGLMLKDAKFFRNVIIFAYLFISIFHSFSLGSILEIMGIKTGLFTFNFYALIGGVLIVWFATKVHYKENGGITNA